MRMADCGTESGPRRVVRTPGVCGGAPCIEGTRLTCADVALQLSASKGDLDGFLGLYPFLTRMDVLGCLDYCGRQLCLVDTKVRYCFRCSLDHSPAPAAPGAFIDSPDDLRGIAEAASVGQVFLGTPADYEKDMTPMDIWMLSRELSRDLTS